MRKTLLDVIMKSKNLPTELPDGAIAGGVRVYGDGEVATSWFVFPRAGYDELEAIGAAGFSFGYYIAPGCRYANDPKAVARGSRVLVTQDSGLDV